MQLKGHLDRHEGPSWVGACPRVLCEQGCLGLQAGLLKLYRVLSSYLVDALSKETERKEHTIL